MKWIRHTDFPGILYKQLAQKYKTFYLFLFKNRKFQEFYWVFM